MLTFAFFPASANNYTPGREKRITQVVLHTMVGTIASARTTFQNDHLAAPRSAHFGVPYYGGVVDRYVNPFETAWHAGNWPVNQRSIGIEHEDFLHYDEPRPFGLYVTSAALLATLQVAHGFPLVLVDDPERPGVMRHRTAVATHCPGTLDVDLIIGMARGETGVFDPRQNPEDLAFLDKRIREIVMGEDIAAYALYVALGRYTGNLPLHVRNAIARARKTGRPKIVKRKRVPVAKVRAGHGRG